MTKQTLLRDLDQMDEMLDQYFGDNNQYIKVGLSTSIRNAAKYGGKKWILRSPGSDLLSYYDEQNLLLGSDNRAYSKIPPSLVFDVRFKLNINKSQEIRYYCKNFYDIKDPTYWFQVRDKRYAWLTEEESQTYEFEFKKDLVDFLKTKFNQPNFYLPSNPDKDWTKMFWRGKCAGWSIIKG